MPKVVVVEKLADVVNNIFKFFSADERRKRRKLQYDDNIAIAVDLQEKHYDELLSFLEFIYDKVDLPKKEDKKYFKLMIAKFKKQNRRFKELT